MMERISFHFLRSRKFHKVLVAVKIFDFGHRRGSYFILRSNISFIKKSTISFVVRVQRSPLKNAKYLFLQYEVLRNSDFFFFVSPFKNGKFS